MRHAAFWAINGLLLAAALSVVVSATTVRWLYPSTPRPSTRMEPLPFLKSHDADEQVALSFLRYGSYGDFDLAQELSMLSRAEIESQVTEFKPIPLRAARLPGSDPQSVLLLVWTNYTRGNLRLKGQYEVTVAGGRVQKLTGPIAPVGGYRPLTFPLLDQAGQPIDRAQYNGKALLLVAPRIPENGLVRMLTDLEQVYADQGLLVALVLDLRAPDWGPLARQSGFTGPIWRLKGNLEEVPVVSGGEWLGAVGLLVDKEGEVVASLTALDPGRYGLANSDSSASAAHSAVLRAYGLID